MFGAHYVVLERLAGGHQAIVAVQRGDGEDSAKPAFQPAVQLPGSNGDRLSADRSLGNERVVGAAVAYANEAASTDMQAAAPEAGLVQGIEAGNDMSAESIGDPRPASPATSRPAHSAPSASSSFRLTGFTGTGDLSVAVRLDGEKPTERDDLVAGLKQIAHELGLSLDDVTINGRSHARPDHCRDRDS